MMCVVIVLSFYLILLQYFYAFELTQVNEKNVKIDFNSLCSYSIPVGISNYYIPDQNLEATSFFNKARKAQYGRLNSFRAGGSWTAGVSNINQHLTIDLGYQYAINKISTQGRQGSNEFVTEYFVEYSIDKNIWYSYKNQYGSNQLFIGNFDDSSVVENELGNPLIAQYVRINPQRWNNMISIRIELYGCRYKGNKAYFNGNGYITYNLMKPENYYSSLTNNIQIRFKTTFINGILFMTDSSLGDYILIHLHHATLYVDINLGIDKHNLSHGTFKIGSLLDDGKWHDFKMIRNKRFINITMDAFHDHVFVSGSFEKLNLDKIISIGAINPYKSGSSFKKLLSYKNFTGCLDRVWFDGIDMLENARIKEHRFEKNSDVIYNGCKISSISCLNFLTEESNIIANAMPSRFIHFEFDFRTYYTQCSILIHEMSEGKINIEIDKHGQISVYIEGSNKINIKSVIKPLHTKSYSDGLWHTFILDGRSANAVEPAIFNITIDGLNYVSKRMMFYKTGKIYNVGGTNYAAAIVGFIGCIKNIYVGKEKINKWKSNSVNTESCRIVDRCTPNPCEHGGICHQNSFAFFCDCSRTGYEGSVCHKSMYSMSCDEVRRQNPTLKNMKTKIDYDDTGYMEPIEVNCIFFHDEKYSITEISHDSTHRLLIDGYQHPGSYIRNINYNNANEKHFDMITDRASKCEQFISYQCHNTRLLTTTGSHDKTKLTWGWWVGRYGKQLRYWGGGIEGLSMCQCGLIDECPSPNAPCTCDSGDSEEDLHDSGFLNYKEDLPVMQLRFGDSGDLKDHKYAFHKLGKLRCYDDDLYKDVITFFAIDSSIQLETFNTNFTTSSDIRFEFKTTASTGVIIHCKGQTHFIEISILDPNTIQFIFDAGDGAQTLTKVVAYRLNDDMWHTVHVERNHLNSLLKIDYQAQVTLDEPKNREFRYLQLSSKLYIGSSVDNSNGFIGCFRALVINGYIVNLKKIVDGFIKPYGVSTGCNAKCKQNPCLNGGICIEGYSFYKCDCAYTPFRGWNCGREVGIHFQSNWMVRYEFNKITGDISTDEENIIVGFSTEDKQGILMSIQNENGEYITIQVNNNGGIRVVLDVGSERDELNNDIFDVDLANGQQHILKVKRSNRGRNLSIQVDDYPIARKYWNLHSSADTKLDFPKYIYFGRNSTDNIRGFKGCLFRIQFNNVYPFRRLFRNPSKNNLKFYPEEDGDRMIESMCGFEEVTPFEEPKYIRGAKEADLRNLEFDIFDLIVKENDNYLFIWVTSSMCSFLILLGIGLALYIFFYKFKGYSVLKERYRKSKNSSNQDIELKDTQSEQISEFFM